MVLILFILAYLFVLIWPVRFAARMVGAGRDGIFVCFIAVIIVATASNGLAGLDFGGDTLTLVGVFAAFFIISAVIFMLLLDTTFKGGLVISLVQTALSVVLVFIFTLAIGALFPELAAEF